MRSLRSIIRSSVLVALAISLSAGCSKLPTDPVAQTGAHSRQAEQTGLVSSFADIIEGLITRTLDLVGRVGGSLTNGRWKVVLPPGAIEGSATVQLGVASVTSPSCQLEILPADRNHFQVPVTLTVDCRGVPDEQLKTYAIFWYSPETRTWVPVAGSKVDLVTKTVSAPLTHFSKYGVGANQGKAGW